MALMNNVTSKFIINASTTGILVQAPFTPSSFFQGLISSLLVSLIIYLRLFVKVALLEFNNENDNVITVVVKGGSTLSLVNIFTVSIKVLSIINGCNNNSLIEVKDITSTSWIHLTNKGLGNANYFMFLTVTKDVSINITTSVSMLIVNFFKMSINFLLIEKRILAYGETVEMQVSNHADKKRFFFQLPENCNLGYNVIFLIIFIY